MNEILFQLYIWQLKDNDLMGVAFIDTHIYIHTLVTIKHIILAGDILKSVSVYQYQEEHKVLSIVSRVSSGAIRKMAYSVYKSLNIHCQQGQ